MFDTWDPPSEVSAAEARILGLCKKQKLWSFLRNHRHQLVDEETRTALRALYPSSRGPDPVCPERLLLAMLLQVAFDVPDHEVPTLTAVDRRWRMVLDLLDAPEDKSAFGQGTVFNFRERAREGGLARFMIDKTVRLARETKGFSHKRLRAIFDSSPLLGAGRVEDSFNLLGRAIGSLVKVAAAEAGRSAEDLATELQVSVLSAPSVKACLDVDWRQPEARNEALNELLAQFARLQQWLSQQFAEERLETPPLSESLRLVERLIEQDTEPDPDRPEGAKAGSRRVKSGGTARQISLADADMRHGRKSKNKVFSGYKRHIALDADVQGLVVDVEVLPANQHEQDAAEPLLSRLALAGFDVVELHHDRGYLSAPIIHERRKQGMKVVSKPPTPVRREGRFSKADFDIDVVGGRVTCPAGQTALISHGKRRTAYFRRSTCRGCALRDQCLPKAGQRTIVLHEHEAFYQEMAAELATPEGRAERRARVPVEHALARVGAIQGRRARFFGRAKNQFDLERVGVVSNLYVLRLLFEEAA